MYKLLFVDDEVGVLNVIKESMEWEKLNVKVVEWCNNGVQALEVLTNESVDILITDIKMPVMDGLELVQRAKKMQNNIECVVLTGFGEFELAKSAIEKGVIGYLLKPCKKEELEEVINKCIHKLEKNSCASFYWLNERQKQVERTYEGLCNIQLKTKDGKVSNENYEIIKNQIEKIRDYGILREAVVSLIFSTNMQMEDMKKILTELQKSQDVDSFIKCIFYILRRKQGQVTKNMNDPVVEMMKDYTREHYDFPYLTVQYLAEKVVFLSPKYIGKRFLKETGMKYSDYLLKIRMEKAILLLEKGEISTEQLAERVGLGDNLPYFYRLFKQYTGKTLKEYKKTFGGMYGLQND